MGLRMSTPAPTTCPCGHDEKSPFVRPKPQYTLWGWFLLMWGISAKPLRVTYRCDKCGGVVKVY